MRRTLIPSSFCALLVLTLASCAHASEGSKPEVPIVVTDDPEAEAAYREARAAEVDGRIDEAAEGYTAFLERFPDDPLRPLAQLNLGRVRLAKGEHEAAVVLLEPLLEAQDEEIRERASLHLGLARHIEGKNEEAIDLLVPLEGKLLDAQERTLLSRTLAASCLETKRHVCAVEALDELVRDATEDVEREELHAEVRRIVESEVNDEELATLYDELPRDGVAWPLVAKRMLTRVFAAGDVEMTRRIAAELRAHNVELTGDILAMAQRAETIATADPNAIGLLLPLSGRGQEAGQEALRGIMFATGRFEGTGSTASTNLVVRDTGSDVDRTLRAIDELVAVHRVIAIIGTIDGAVAAAAAKRCQELRIPFLSLSVSGNVTESSEWAMRLLPSALPEARELARAARDVGATRVAVLRPENAYAERVSAAFAEEARALGMTIVRELSYPEDTRDFRKHVKELEQARPDVIFLPERSARVSVLAPTLATAGLWSPRDTRLPSLGTRLVLPSIAWDETLLETSGRYLERALVALPFKADEAGKRFDASYRERYGKAPSVFATSAHDAYVIAREVLASGVVTREAFLQRARGIAPEGLVGPSQGISPGRGPRAHASVAEVLGSKLEPVQRTR